MYDISEGNHRPVVQFSTVLGTFKPGAWCGDPGESWLLMCFNAC